MANKEKGLNAKRCAVVIFIAVVAAAVIICAATFGSGYTASDPEKVAKAYVDTIVQTGDGYNAYKYTLVSKSTKYGDFIRKYYINPAIYRDTEYQIGGSTDGLVGYNDESYKGENTLNDNGTLESQVIHQMYFYYENLMKNIGWDNYDLLYNLYLQRLIEVREEIFGDKYLSDEIFFTAFEANVASYGKSLTGTEDEFDKKTGVQSGDKSVGAYEDAYGENYKFSVVIADTEVLDPDEYKASVPTVVFETYGVNPDDITEVQSMLAEVKDFDGGIVTETNVVVVKIGRSWYVDNTATDTDPLYNFYIMQ